MAQDLTMKRKAKYDREPYDLSLLAKDNIDRLTLERVPSKSKVLELGAATGYMTQYMAQKLDCSVTAVDLDAAALEYAKIFSEQTIVGDLDDSSTWRKIRAAGPYEVILASNVVEHLSDTNFQLKQAREALSRQGRLIIVVPNIAWWRSRWKLLRGIWNYEEYGLWDETHLRFFTVPSLRLTLKRNGFHVIDEAYDPAGGAKWFTPLLKQFPNAYAYQVVMVAEKVSL